LTLPESAGAERQAATAALLQAAQLLPASLQARQQWLLWRFEAYEGDKKPRKVPYYVSGRKRRGQQGSAEDLAELSTFEAACAHLGRGRYDGLGFAFLPGDGLVGIDIDNAVDDDGVVSERCSAIVAACNSYAEYSPSGRGVHIICAGEVESFRENSIGLEVYSGRQFFTMTGRPWPDAPAEVHPLADGVWARLRATREAARQQRKPAAKAAAPEAPGSAPSGLSDFARVNAVALALLDSWVPQILPSARKHGTGAWRVKSRELGRDLQEDLSLHPSGISDWGEEVGLTPIDVVVRFGGKTPAQALRWLAGAVGLQLTPPARKTKAAAGGASTPSPGSAQGGGGEPPDDDGPPPADAEPPKPGKRGKPSWMQRLVPDRGGWKDCRENVFLLLQDHPALAGLVAFDEFAHRVLKVGKAPWETTPGEWTTQDDYSLGLWLTEQVGLTVRSEATLVAGVAMAAFKARFHPVLQYLAALPAWDQTERLPFWLSECLGAADTPYTRLVGTWFVMGMVQRVRQPGCQMDYMIVLEGLQGKRKSTALRTLVGVDDWFADTPIRIGDKDAMLSLAGKWLYEIGELDSFNRAEVTAVKQYISSRIDRVREPFARRPADRPRSGVFAGSTNQAEYFKDPTGARRFWPVKCDGEIELDRLSSWRDQLFAEAMARLGSADPEVARYYPTRAETEEFLVPEQEQREIGDPWFEKLATWVDSAARVGDSLEEACQVESFTSYELLTKAIGVPMDRIDGARQMSTRVGIAMHKLGWEKRRDTAPPRLWRYWRPKRRPTGTTPAPAHSLADEVAGGPATGGEA
jgi:putative DNA primase/helicase